jgi:hypothetical protein
MDNDIVVAIIVAASALIGSAVGGISSYFSTKSMRKLEWRLSETEREISSRRTLYARFIAESNNWIIRSVDMKVNHFAEMQELVNIYSEISLLSPIIGRKAKEIVSCVIDHHEKGNQQHGTYPALRDSFIDLCLQEAKSMRSEV